MRELLMQRWRRTPLRLPIRLRVAVLTLPMAVLTTVALAGCGGGDLLAIGAAPTPEYLAQAAERTATVETGRVEVTLTAQIDTLQGDAGTVTVTLDGAFDTARGAAAASVTATVPDGGTVPDGETLTFDVVLADDALYVRPGGVAAALGEALGRPWLRAELGDLSSVLPPELELATIDPAELLARLEAEGVVVTEVGPERVRDVDTTHYTATVTGEQGSAEVHAWIDAVGLVRRLEVDGTGPAGQSVTVRAELFDLGGSVDVDVPPADEVTDLGDLSALTDLLGSLSR